jgi:hypothetical protein
MEGRRSRLGSAQDEARRLSYWAPFWQAVFHCLPFLFFSVPVNRFQTLSKKMPRVTMRLPKFEGYELVQ